MAEARRSGLLSQSQAEGVPEEYQRQIMKMGNIKEFAQQMAEEQQSGDDDGDDDVGSLSCKQLIALLLLSRSWLSLGTCRIAGISPTTMAV